MKKIINEEVRKKINLLAKKIVKEALEDNEVVDVYQKKKISDDPDDFNGMDPSEKSPAERVVLQAVKEYCNQTGKMMYIDDFNDIFLGIVRAFDSTDKIQDLRKFIVGVTNTEDHLRNPEEKIEDFDEPEGEDEFSFETPTEDSVGEEDLDTVDGIESGEEKMDKKKDFLEEE